MSPCEAAPFFLSSIFNFSNGILRICVSSNRVLSGTRRVADYRHGIEEVLDRSVGKANRKIRRSGFFLSFFQ
jgi:hypothetical protein